MSGLPPKHHGSHKPLDPGPKSPDLSVMRAALIAALAMLLGVLSACDDAPAAPPPASATATLRFPLPDRPVSSIVSDRWSDEESRDSEGEAADVFRLLDVRRGQHVADIGAGSGYYTVRLSPRVGPDGMVYANDIIPDYLNRLKRRVQSAGLPNVQFILGDPGNTRLPAASTDLALMVHMYHEIEDPFGLLWHLHDSLSPNARVAILDADRTTDRHGTPPGLLRCELAVAGYRQVAFHPLKGNYLAVFEPTGRPDPAQMKACRA